MSSTLIPKRLLEPISFSIGQFASCFYIKSEKWICIGIKMLDFIKNIFNS